MRRHRLQKIERAEAVEREAVPQAIVAAGPHEPHVAAFNLGLCKHRALAVDEVVVHVTEVIVGGPGKMRRRQPGAHCFVLNSPRLRSASSSACCVAGDDERGETEHHTKTAGHGVQSSWMAGVDAAAVALAGSSSVKFSAKRSRK